MEISFSGALTKDAVDIQTPNGQSHLAWTDFSGYGEHKDLIVLFQSTTLAFPFPRRFFQNQADWESFRTFVAQKLPVTHRV